MRRDYACHCCGLGLAFSGFYWMQSIFNYLSFIVGRSMARPDEDGWAFWSVDKFDPLRGRTLQPDTQLNIEIARFAFRVDSEAQEVLIEFDLDYIGNVSATNWGWTLLFRIPFADYNLLPAHGRLRLNDFLESATHRGFTSSSIGTIVGNDLIGTTGPTNIPDHLGEMILVWPPFVLDWTDKKLEVEIVPAQDTVVVSIGGNQTAQVLDLSWLEDPFEFVFDDTTLQTNENPWFQFYRDTHQHGFASDCYDFFRATHIEYLTQAPTPASLPLLRLEFRSAQNCDRVPRNTALSPQMNWSITAVWWKAFEQNGVVTLSHGDELDAGVSPILHTVVTNFFAVPLTDAQKQALPLEITLTLTDIEEDE